MSRKCPFHSGVTDNLVHCVLTKRSRFNPELISSRYFYVCSYCSNDSKHNIQLPNSEYLAITQIFATTGQQVYFLQASTSKHTIVFLVSSICLISDTLSLFQGNINCIIARSGTWNQWNCSNLGYIFVQNLICYY